MNLEPASLLAACNSHVRDTVLYCVLMIGRSQLDIVIWNTWMVTFKWNSI